MIIKVDARLLRHDILRMLDAWGIQTYGSEGDRNLSRLAVDGVILPVTCRFESETLGSRIIPVGSKPELPEDVSCAEMVRSVPPFSQLIIATRRMDGDYTLIDMAERGSSLTDPPVISHFGVHRAFYGVKKPITLEGHLENTSEKELQTAIKSYLAIIKAMTAEWKRGFLGPWDEAALAVFRAHNLSQALGTAPDYTFPTEV